MKFFTAMTPTFLLLLLLSLVGLTLVSSDNAALQDKCSPAIGRLGECLGFASGKADAPSSACCSTVADTRQKEPVCLCFIIQMAHAGGSSVDSLGLQMGRLVQLPSACKLADTDISNCPKLLNLSRSSPDYAIFSNSTKAGTSSTTAATTTTTTTTTPAGPSTTKPSSKGAVHQINVLGTFFVTAFSAILLSIFWIGA